MDLTTSSMNSIISELLCDSHLISVEVKVLFAQLDENVHSCIAVNNRKYASKIIATRCIVLPTKGFQQISFHKKQSLLLFYTNIKWFC